MISVLVLTLNEENNIARCLSSVAWSDDVVVLDSGSSDKTVEIAKSMGARVYTRPFDNEASQRLYSIRNIEFKHNWVFNPDADEVATTALVSEMLARVEAGGDGCAAFRVRFRTMFCGKWLRWSSLYPTWVVRLFRPEKLSFSRDINLTYHVDGDVGYLREHFLHFTFNNGIAAWFDKHNRYSSKEACEVLKSLERGDFGFSHMLTGGAVERRRILKELSFRFPFRPLLRFFYMYVIRLGFLDGLMGLRYCVMLSIYEYMIDLKVKEIKLRAKGGAI